MSSIQAEELLVKAGIRPTSNRIMVLRELEACGGLMSLTDLETRIETLDKSSIFRVLTLLLSHHLVHSVEDGRGIVKYEVCHGEDHCSVDDMHVHFYCDVCHSVYCFDQIPVPVVDLPEGFSVGAVNYMLKGVCPSCNKKV